MTRPLWNNVTGFPVSVDLMEASGVLKTNKCLGLTRKEGDFFYLVIVYSWLGFIYIFSCKYNNLELCVVEYICNRQLYN